MFAYSCCVFRPAFGCCAHPKAGPTSFLGQNTQHTVFVYPRAMVGSTALIIHYQSDISIYLLLLEKKYDDDDDLNRLINGQSLL